MVLILRRMFNLWNLRSFFNLKRRANAGFRDRVLNNLFKRIRKVAIEKLPIISRDERYYNTRFHKVIQIEKTYLNILSCDPFGVILEISGATTSVRLYITLYHNIRRVSEILPEELQLRSKSRTENTKASLHFKLFI